MADLRKIKDLLENVMKNKDLIIFLGVCGIFLLVVSANFSTSSKQTSATIKQQEIQEDGQQYEQLIEKKLEDILKEIDPTGDVSVMITFDDCYEYVLATETRENRRSEKQNQNTTISEEEIDSKVVVLQQQGESKPFVVKKIYPKVRGVAIVSKGARDKRIYIGLVKAASTVLGITPDKVEVFVK
ncbi:conserved hypothetical protein [Caldicellulosiruptor hydrothermalis 108]|uniref:Stage III sporulation protein AG n=1 Tax=Caldicellulosiruptor hydrothermalis (strain DSM 18901 / VKM B-2411 / 108) TaxID=632292 RepID=E4QCN2_CALH1|nr:hypothetical protein [Caldicellulosiruptor hydrothermalis]ADQ07449.1 conserved hypothetical protein [Caldicellulosiruptor hydrothermalis 108]